MRRIIAIILAAIIIAGLICAFLYGVYDPFTNMVNGLIFGFLGPTAVSGASAFNAWLVATLGYTGVYALILSIGAIVGIAVHFLWVKADWSLRGWGAKRTAKDLGVTPVTISSGTTPLGATTRPVAITKPAATPTPEPELQPQEQQEASK